LLQVLRDLADGKMPGGFENGDAFSEMAAALGLPLDVDETQDAFIYTADVPGLEKGDLKVTPRLLWAAQVLHASAGRGRPQCASTLRASLTHACHLLDAASGRLLAAAGRL